MSENKKKTRIYGINLEKIFKTATPYYAILVDEDGNPLIGKEVNFNILNKNYSSVTSSDGSVSLDINLNPRTYTIVTSFKGDFEYLPSETKNKVIVTPKPQSKPKPQVKPKPKPQAKPRKLTKEEILKKYPLRAYPVSDEVIINVKDLTMEFDLSKERVDNLKEYIIRALKRQIPPKTKFKALNHVSFKVRKGERLGVIGFNGAGKSTLLKILSGVMKPTEGEVKVKGNVAPLLELGAGFDHNYTGSENIFLNGAILGYTRDFLEEKYDEIAEFSELGEFLQVPIKNYSSGMKAKLGFSIATVVSPDILILDEVLSVGDVKFREKSTKKLESLMKKGVTVILVSHSIGAIRKICNTALWLDHGKVMDYGDVDEVCDKYIEAAKSASKAQLANIKLN